MAPGHCDCAFWTGHASLVRLTIIWGSHLITQTVWMPLLSLWVWLSRHPINTRGDTVGCPGRFGIGYKCCAFAGGPSLDTAPVTGSLLLAASERRLTDSSTAGLGLLPHWHYESGRHRPMSLAYTGLCVVTPLSSGNL